MQGITVIDKVTMEKLTVESGVIKVDSASIIQTELHREDIAEIIQEGNNLIIKLKSGETLTIENYFLVDAAGNTTELVFEGTECALLQLVMKDGIVGFKELAGLEELLPIAVGGGISGTGPLPWVVGGIVAGGIGAATGGSSGSDTAKNQKFLKRLALKLRMIKIMMSFSTNKNLQDYQQ